MDCINCSNKNVSIVTSSFICEYCGKTNCIDYYVCSECGKIWNVNIPESFEEDEITIPLMSDYIHRCLMCNTISYEKEKDSWCCPECGFQWEAISCDKSL
jgi:DNA-directed RNA polymerase subunit RPC12/RpoP